MSPGSTGLDSSAARRRGESRRRSSCSRPATRRRSGGGPRSGADDYLTKPFSFAELVAGLHALDHARRAAGSGDRLSYGGFRSTSYARGRPATARQWRCRPRSSTLLESSCATRAGPQQDDDPAACSGNTGSIRRRMSVDVWSPVRNKIDAAFRRSSFRPCAGWAMSSGAMSPRRRSAGGPVNPGVPSRAWYAGARCSGGRLLGGVGAPHHPAGRSFARRRS